MTYPGFRQFIIQLAIHGFSRPPHNLSQQPLVKSLEALLSLFEESTKKRQLSTLLYEDPDAIAGISQKDRDLIKQLNVKVNDEPDYPVPEGFTKVREKVPVYKYEVPDTVRPFLGEEKSVAIELIDELLGKLFDIHVIEPIVKQEEKYRVKPTL